MEFFIEVIKEKDFVTVANKASTSLLNFVSFFLDNKNKKLSKRFYVELVKESMELEEFLDDHGARNNKTWIYFGEMVASIRNFSGTAYIISHILSRIKFYKLDNKKVTVFIRDAKKSLEFLNKSIFALFAHLKNEALDLGLTIPPANIKEENFEENFVIKVLPQNINDQGAYDMHDYISRVATEFNSTFNDSNIIMFDKKLLSHNLDSKIIPEKINEETLRHLESRIHNAQSMYDTYIQKTPIESKNNILRSLRGYISITLHLLGAARRLSHFFERHETSIRKESTRRKITKIIQRKKVLEVIINFALYYFTLFIKDGYLLANQVLEKFALLESEFVNVPEGLGFHLRPSTLVVKVANHYGSKLTMVVLDKEFDASSVIDIMWAGGMIKKEGLTKIEFRGNKNVIRDLKILAKANYGEDIMGNSTPLPVELSYLRHD